MKISFNIIFIFLIIINCTNLNYERQRVQEYFRIADAYLINDEKEKLADFTFRHLFPNIEYLDKNKKARVLNYMKISENDKYLSVANNYIKNNFSKINKCSLDSSSISYYNELTSCKTTPDYDSLRISFTEILYKDQYYRNLPDNFFTGTKKEIDSIMAVITNNDNQNRQDIKRALSKFGIKKIAENDCDCKLLETIWFVAQHSDSDLAFQKEILQMFSSPLPNIKPRYYTYLIDRIKINEGKKQIYGTQMQINSLTGKMETSPVENPQGLDQLRFNNDLLDLREYVNFINKPDKK